MKRILIIEDNETVRSYMHNVLLGPDIVILEAENGKKGSELFKKEKPDLVITDILMPEKEGFEIISEFKREVPDIKIIAVTGCENFEGTDLLNIAKRLGAVHVLKKPFKEEALKTVVYGVLDSLETKLSD
ncbi:MAG: response regulator [Clostridia bacterium]|nr:response regulator [Clostridia bacterium]